MERLSDGDDSAFNALHDALTPRLYAYALRLAQNTTRADDLVQQSWELIFRARGRFVKGSRVMPWAFAILRNLDRDAKKRPKVEELSVDGLHDAGKSSEQPNPSECTEWKELDELVRQELKRLPPCQQQAVELFYYGGLSQTEVAEVLDVSVAGVKSRIHRATETLRGVFLGSAQVEDP